MRDDKNEIAYPYRTENLPWFRAMQALTVLKNKHRHQGRCWSGGPISSFCAKEIPKEEISSAQSLQPKESEFLNPVPPGDVTGSQLPYSKINKGYIPDTATTCLKCEIVCQAVRMSSYGDGTVLLTAHHHIHRRILHSEKGFILKSVTFELFVQKALLHNLCPQGTTNRCPSLPFRTPTTAKV